jgi:hypothetical protein
MTQGAHEPTNRPKPGTELEPRLYAVVANFQPAIGLSKGIYAFAAAISDYLEAQTVTFNPNQWVFSQPLGGHNANSSIQLAVNQTAIQFEVAYPTNYRLEWVMNKCKMILQVFGDAFKPNILMNSVAKVSGTMEIDGDARQFLVKHITSADPQRLSILKRPIHGFGIRIVSPPYEKKVKKGKKTVTEPVPWSVDFKAESLLEDPAKLYLEAEAVWPVMAAWSESKIPDEIVGRLKTTSDFLGNDAIAFLQNPTTGDET